MMAHDGPIKTFPFRGTKESLGVPPGIRHGE
jgi:hypothetical protein